MHQVLQNADIFPEANDLIITLHCNLLSLTMWSDNFAFKFVGVHGPGCQPTYELCHRRHPGHEPPNVWWKVLIVSWRLNVIQTLLCSQKFCLNLLFCYNVELTHWGRVTHICAGNLTIIGSDNGLSPGRRQAITWTNVGILLIGPLGTKFSEMLIEIHTFSFKKIHLKMSSGKWRPFCLGPNLLKCCFTKCYYLTYKSLLSANIIGILT